MNQQVLGTIIGVVGIGIGIAFFMTSSEDTKKMQEDIEIIHSALGIDTTQGKAELTQARVGTFLGSKQTGVDIFAEKEAVAQDISELKAILAKYEVQEEEYESQLALGNVEEQKIDKDFSNQRANALVMTGDYAQAHVIYDDILKEYPNDMITIENKVWAYGLEGDDDSLLIWADRGLQIDPNSGYLNNEVGVALENLGMWTEALSFYQKSAQYDPDEVVLSNLGWSYLNQDPPQDQNAIAPCEEALDYYPDVRAYTCLASAYTGLEQYDTAISWGNKGLEVFPDDFEILDQMSITYSWMGEWELSLDYALASIATGQITTYNAAGLGWSYVNSDDRYDHDEAIRWLEKSLELDPNNIGAYEGFAYAYNWHGDHELALEWANACLDIDPSNLSCTEDYDWAIEELG